MSSENTQENIKIEPVNLLWGNQQLDKVKTVADNSSSLNNTYFEFQSINNAQVKTDRYVWFNVAAAGTDPALSNKTGTEVAIAENASAAVIAAAIVSALDALADVNSKVDPCDEECVFVQSKGLGVVTPAADGAVATGFTISEVRAGSRLALGYLDGDISLALAEEFKDVTTHQDGTTIIERLKTGVNLESISIPLKEVIAAKLKTFLKTGGEALTPAGGTEVVGWGSSNLFGNQSSLAKKLVFHPVRISDQTDLSEDWGFWKAYPRIEQLNFSGESEQLLNVAFDLLPDKMIDAKVENFVYGDHSQNLLK